MCLVPPLCEPEKVRYGIIHHVHNIEVAANVASLSTVYAILHLDSRSIVLAVTVLGAHNEWNRTHVSV